MKENNIVNEKRYILVCFGTELFLITVIKFVGLFILASILGMLKEALIFIIAFSSLRIQAGGIHSNSFWKCFIITNTLTIVSILLTKYFFIKQGILLLLILLIFSIILVFKYAPVDTPNRIIDESETKKYKKRSRGTVIFGSIMIIISAMFFETSLLYCMIGTIGFFSETMTLTPWVERVKI